jgi:hypothetical protein
MILIAAAVLRVLDQTLKACQERAAIRESPPSVKLRHPAPKGTINTTQSALDSPQDEENTRWRPVTNHITGAGNIADAGRESFQRNDREVVTPAAMQPAPPEDVDYHTGRGGAGNEHLAHGTTHGKEHAVRVADGVRSPQGLADKLKNKLFGRGKK